MNKPIRLPALVYSVLIEKHLDEATCVALAISGAFDGFSSSFTMSRSWKGLVINEQCFYFTPTLWSKFIEQHIALDSIKVFNANHFYWLPGHLLCSTIIQMENLEELSIKGTQVCTINQVAKILQSCPKIKKLDFTYTEKTQEEIASGLKKENISLDSLTAAFQKLTSLKMSTTVPDPEFNVYKDPWLLLIKILSCCRDCTDLAIEITYTVKPRSSVGTSFETWSNQRIAIESVQEAVERDWLPQLAWMKSLKSLVLVKLGPYATRGADAHVILFLLESLVCGYLFPPCEEKPIPRPLRCIWIDNFEVYPYAVLDYADPDYLLSFKSDGHPHRNEDNYEKYKSFHNLENLDGVSAREDLYETLLLSTSKLKYYCGRGYIKEEIYKFCEAHPTLEHLNVGFLSPLDDAYYAVLFQLPKLKSLSCWCYCDISKDFLKAMAEAYPNLETLELSTHDDKGCLPVVSFPKLTSLSLSGFRLRDGAFLLSIIEKCPKLKILHLETDSMESASFLINFKHFLQKAENLREFRLKWTHRDQNYPTTAMSILKAILEKSVLLERLALIDGGSDNLPTWSHPPDFTDLIVEFASKMSHLTCCCISFKQLDCFPIVNVKQRIAQEVVGMRLSLWFHLDRYLPEASDPGVPWVHYHQIVHRMSFVQPRY